MISTDKAPFYFFDIESQWILEEDKRLNASYYGKDAVSARVIIGSLQQKGIAIKEAEELAEKIFWPGRFKRLLVSKDDGKPFLTPSEVMLFFPKARKFITAYPLEVLIEKGWLLITRSGSVGRSLIATDLLAQHILSDDLIRVIPKSREHTAYLYAYFNTWMGQAFLSKNQYGASIRHIEPRHVEAVPVPCIPNLSQKVAREILKAHKLREAAQALLLQAQDLMHTSLQLPKIGKSEEMFTRCFEINASESNWRLDASYHVPIVKKINQHLDDARLNTIELGTKIQSIYVPPRFKRPYVEKEGGIRYLTPSDLPVMKTFDPKYLATEFTDDEKYRLREGEILVVTDGSIGWVSIVTPPIAGLYGSNNFARVLPKADLNAGYLLTYLLSSYGQYQLSREIFGGVVDHITEDQIKQIRIPLPPYEVQQKIGEVMTLAYTKRDEANQIEADTVAFLEAGLKEAAKVS